MSRPLQRLLWVLLGTAILAGLALWFRREPLSTAGLPFAQQTELPQMSAVPAPVTDPVVFPARPLLPPPFDSTRASGGFGVAAHLDRLLSRRAKLPHSSTGRSAFTVFGFEKTYLLTEARLLAAVWPEDSERAASAVALDPSRPAGDRKYAITVLGYLAAAGRKGADAVLLGLARDANEVIREQSIYAVYPSDPKGAYRSVYADQCREANRAAFAALSTDVDTSVDVLMEELRERNDGPIRGEMRLLAEDVRKKTQLLRSPDAESQLAEMLGKVGRPEAEDWLLRAVKVRPPIALQNLLRQRLDRDLEMARKKDSAQREDGIRTGEPMSGDFGSRYVMHVFAELIPDPSYDRLLLALREAGGSLTELENRRLREFGYEGDPRQRLEELLTSHGDR